MGTSLYFDGASPAEELWGDDPVQVVRLACYLREHDPMADEDREWQRLRDIAAKPWKWNGEFAEMLRRDVPPTDPNLEDPDDFEQVPEPGDDP